MALKPLSRIVHGFMAKWLLLPALVGLVCGSAVWIGIEARKIQKEQTYYTKTIAQHVNSYLQQSHRRLKQFAVTYRENGSNQGLYPFLSNYNTSIQTVHLLGNSGKVVESWPREEERTDFRGTIQSASLQEELYLTPPYYSLSQKEIVVGMLVAASGKRLLLAELDLAAIQESIQELTQHMEGGYAFLTDAYGNLLAHPDMSKVNQQVNLGNLNIISHLPSGEAKSGFYNRNGELRLMSATSVPLSDWKVGLSQNAFSLFTQDLWTIALSLAGLLALFGTTALLFDRRLHRMIVYPLTQFTQDLDALEQGKPPVGNSEMSLPASEDCSELWSLQKNFQSMQRTVRERETALRQSENYYRTIFETSGSAMFIIEEDATISLVNSNFEELSGYSREELEGKKPWNDFLHSVDLARMRQNNYLRDQSATDVPRQYEIRLLTRHCEERDVFLSIDMIPGTKQSIVSCIDLTQRKQTEEALRKSEERYKKLINTSPDAIALADDKGKFLAVNPTMAQRFDYPQTELEGKTFYDVMHYELVDKRIAYAKESIENNKLIYFEDERDGKYIQNYYVPIDTSDNQRTFQIIARDITERKQMEEKLKSMSYHDSLTGLYNRNFFEEEMQRLSYGRYSPLGIIVCDLDGLKFANDTLGHHAGDQMLIQAADILRQNFRLSDIIARIGGDEFAVLLTETDQETVEQMLQRIRQALQDYNNTDPERPLSLSMGYALGKRETEDIQALFREADNRMYREKIQRDESARSAILQALTVSMEARDFNTENHCERLQELAAFMARSLNLSQDFVNDLYLLARFHDLGKVGIPDQILFKPGPLTEEEWRQMRQHCEIGHRIASSVPDLEPIADHILKHHEWWDGQGYPLGLSGGDIPLPCRILSIADAYDAMTSDRPYRKAMSREEAIAELKRCAGTQFDPKLVEQLIQVAERYDF